MFYIVFGVLIFLMLGLQFLMTWIQDDVWEFVLGLGFLMLVLFFATEGILKSGLFG